MTQNSEQKKAARFGVGCAVFLFLAFVVICSGVLSGTPKTPAELEAQQKRDRLEIDQFRQDELRHEDEEKARDQLLRDGHTPEETEKIVGEASVMQRAIQDSEKDKSSAISGDR